VTARGEWDNTYREARELLAAAHEGWDATTRQAAMRRHPSGFSLDEVNPVWTDCDQLAAWTAHLDDEPTDHPRLLGGRADPVPGHRGSLAVR